MKSLRHLVLLCSSLFPWVLSAQLQVSASSVPSVCFNDGSITASASGGSIPYHFQIMTGPNLAGLSYPLPPTNGINEFLSIPSGVYLLMVVDNNNDTAQLQVTVGGSYTFPVAQYTIIDGYNIHIQPSGGMPPYQYAISSVASNGPFGPLQSSPVFDTLCNGTYYVRMYDSCGNIYTTTGIVVNQPKIVAEVVCGTHTDSSHTFTAAVMPGTGTPPFTYYYQSGNFTLTSDSALFTIPGLCFDTITIFDGCNRYDTDNDDCVPLDSLRVICSDFVTNDITLGVTGGSAPYTFSLWTTSGNAYTNNDGVFTNLPYQFEYWFIAEDNCGRKDTLLVIRMLLAYFPHCPFVPDIYFTLAGQVEYPATITCNNCIPLQQYTIQSPALMLFTNMNDSTIYNFTISDTCGVTMYTNMLLRPDSVDVHPEWLSCNDISFEAYTTAMLNVTDSSMFELNGNNGYHKSNSTGLFPDLPDGVYTLITTYSPCLQNVYEFRVPHFPEFCLYPTFNDACTRSYDLRLKPDNTTDLPEKLTISSLGLGILQNEWPAGALNGAYFNDLPVGAYTISSDSGCTSPFVLDPHPVFVFEAYDSVDCLDNQFLIARCNPPYLLNNCEDTTDFIMRVFKNNVMISESATGDFLVPDSGDYVIGLFYKRNPAANYPAVSYAFNDSCFADSIHIRAHPKTLPEVFAEDKQVCGMSMLADIPYTITGGVLPYTLNVPGLGVYAVQDTLGYLTGLAVDNYTMIAYDNCGISNSLTVSVVDTCFVCGTLSAFIAEDSVVCAGATLLFIDTAQLVQEYKWLLNGQVVGINDSLIYTFTDSGQYTLMCVAANISCIDSTELLIKVSAKDSFELGPDMYLCPGSSVVLSAAPDIVVWMNTTVDSSYVATSEGNYMAATTNQCGTFTDSILVLPAIVPSPNLGPDFTLCPGDTVWLSTPVAFDSVLWTTGSTADSIAITQAGSYSISAYLTGCISYDEVVVDESDEAPFFSLGADTSFCIPFTLNLQTGYTNTVWSNGQSGAVYQADEGGVYWAEVSNACGSFIDSIVIGYYDTAALSIGDETITCDSILRTFIVNTPYDSVRWSNGDTKHYTYLLATGTYSVTVYKDGCEATDDVHVTNYRIPYLTIPDSLVSCGTSMDLRTSLNDVRYVWSDLSTGSFITVPASGSYSVTVSNACGVDSATVAVVLLGDDCRLALPTAFTPNGDGHNDVFAPKCICHLQQYYLAIYNRWGEQIFETKDFDTGWDGNYRSALQPPGTYMVYMQYYDNCERAINSKQSEVTLLR